MQVQASSSSTRSYNPFAELAASDGYRVHRGADRQAWNAAVEAWKHADAAHTALPALEAQCAAVSTRLAQERATLQALREANSRMYGELHGGKRSGFKAKLTKLRPGHPSATPTAARDGSGSPTSPTGVRRRSTQEDFAASYPAEAKALDAVEQTQQLEALLLDELKVAKDLAAAVEERFLRLRDAAVLMFPPTFVAASAALSQAVHALGDEEDAARDAHTISFDMERACTCIQSTHFYHRKVLGISDSMLGMSNKFQSSESKESALLLAEQRPFWWLCFPVFVMKSASLGSFGPLAQINTHNQYIAAKNESFRGQTCLSEGLRLLDKHEALIPPETRLHVAKLKDLGVGQMDRIYELLYGNTFFSGDRVAKNKQIEGLFDAQEKIYKHLTDLALWLQNVVPEFERSLDDVICRRREARRTAVEQWERALRDAEEATPPLSIRSPTPPPPPSPVTPEDAVTRPFLTVQVTAAEARPMSSKPAGKRPLPPVPAMRPFVL
ncbi:hypothetical protein AURDEDRAFT_174756 [Auricularia subglabra TFB-10046 SS5]|uniref:Uncharacterized protein n=1 Tax=Auricularia subglabra (strain TFB-10046 / SS5) TaxID=717982 RepID=J0CY50_AURST|nr:hypothetical protein AURDEDRAFT_174756 [Auricularia subglabra TFB-10046 SS5]